MTKKPSRRLALVFETLQPLVLDSVTGGIVTSEHPTSQETLPTSLPPPLTRRIMNCVSETCPR